MLPYEPHAGRHWKLTLQRNDGQDWTTFAEGLWRPQELPTLVGEAPPQEILDALNKQVIEPHTSGGIANVTVGEYSYRAVYERPD